MTMPGLVMVCSCPAPDPAHPSFAAFIIISTLRLFSARREPPFMVQTPLKKVYQIQALEKGQIGVSHHISHNWPNPHHLDIYSRQYWVQ